MAELQVELKESRLRSDLLLVLLNKFTQARSEKQILEAVMQAGAEYLGVKSASFVPYDEWGLSLPALAFGSGTGVRLQSWSERLSLPETRQVCKNCAALHGGSSCVLITNSQNFCPGIQVKCFPLNSAGRQVGVFNFFYEDFTETDVDDENTKKFFADILEATGKALENFHSLYAEVAGIQSLRQQQSFTFASQLNLSTLLGNLLTSTQQLLDVDFVFLYVPGFPDSLAMEAASQFYFCSRDGTCITDGTHVNGLEGIWVKFLVSGQIQRLDEVSLSIGNRNLSGTVWAVPVLGNAGVVAGVLGSGPWDQQSFGDRKQSFAVSMAGVAAFLIQYKSLMMQVEYQSVVDERTRLAREMHDGLAQTLAFLKIQTGQMQKYLDRGENEKLAAMLQANHRTLADAYIDARQAIEDLRRLPSGRLRDWIEQVASDFEQATLLPVNLQVAEFKNEFPANIQAQLIRIVQEALSNIRKHAGAHSVVIFGAEEDETVLIEVRDDGRGFSPESVDGNLRYGMLGMRERAESIGADFQIASQVGKGTIVSLRIPEKTWQEHRSDAEHSA